VPEGSGRITLGSGAFAGPYSLRARVEEGARTTRPGWPSRRPCPVTEPVRPGLAAGAVS